MSDTVIVNVGQGALRGRRATTKSGGSFCSFQGIPYAQPPVGPLRFKAPQPPKPWAGTRDALTEGNVCPHIDEVMEKYVGDEDCLFLNVYTPQLPASGTEGAMSQAVMVYIHGGGFANGSGNSQIYGPDYLVDEGVVLVTINYRLGPLGFLTTEDGEIPGNAGLKDQVAALRWVQQNIARFGGDPSNVTIFGESAGGASVHYHMLSPMSKGLFHRAISQSGSALNCWAFSRDGRSRTIHMAQGLGCKSDSPKDVLEFLRDIPAKQLVENMNIGLTAKEIRIGVWYSFVPTSEKNVESSEEKFLPSDPIDIITNGNFNRVPFIIGFNSNEGLLMIKGMKGPETFTGINNDFQSLLMDDLCPELDTEHSRKVAQKIKQFYFGKELLSNDTILQYFQLKSDNLFVHKIIETAKLQMNHSSPPIYMYQFAYEGRLAFLKNVVGASNYPGVCHADDLGYLFNIMLMNLDIEPEAPEVKIRTMFTKMWTNFAKTGNPSLDLKWDPISHDKMRYLRIDLEPKMLENLEDARYKFWENLYKESSATAK